MPSPLGGHRRPPEALGMSGCQFAAGHLSRASWMEFFEALEAFLEPPGVPLRPSWSLLGRSWRPHVSPSPTAGLGGFHSDLGSFLFSTPYRTSTSLNLTPLNSTHLNSLFDPPRPPFWSLLGTQIDPRSAPSRLLRPSFLKNTIFQNIAPALGESTILTPRRHPRRPKIDPRRLQDDLQEPSFFDFVFDIDLCPSWVEIWPHLGSLLGSKIGAS